MKINNFIRHFFRCLVISNYWKFSSAIGVEVKVNGVGDKWTIQLGESGRFKAPKVDGPELKWTVFLMHHFQAKNHPPLLRSVHFTVKSLPQKTVHIMFTEFLFGPSTFDRPMYNFYSMSQIRLLSYRMTLTLGFYFECCEN